MIVTVADNKTAQQIEIKTDECVFFQKIKCENIPKVKELMEQFKVVSS